MFSKYSKEFTRVYKHFIPEVQATLNSSLNITYALLRVYAAYQIHNKDKNQNPSIYNYQLRIIYNIGDFLQIGRSSLNRENLNAIFVSHSGNSLLNPDPSHYSTLGHDAGRYSTVEL